MLASVCSIKMLSTMTVVMAMVLPSGSGHVGPRGKHRMMRDGRGFPLISLMGARWISIKFQSKGHAAVTL